MPAFWIRRESVAAATQSDAADEKIIARIRLVLGLAAFLSATAAVVRPNLPLLMLLGAYATSALALFLAAEADAHLPFQRALHWVDLIWCFLFLNLGNFDTGLFFLFFFFVILAAGLRHGFDEGAKASLIAAIAYVFSTLIDFTAFDLPLIFVQTIFICALGYLIAQLGEQRLQMRRRIGLLRTLAQPANPRLGVEHTITSMMERTRNFFAADRCVLVIGCADEGWCLRTVQGGSPLSVPPEPISAEAAAPFLTMPQDCTVLYRRTRMAMPLASYPHERRHWQTLAVMPCARVADLLETDSFISAPVILSDKSGRVYVSRSHQAFTRGDALFLTQAVAQAMPVAENVALLDRIASDAANDERQRLALNVHDTAIQPYIGLALGLAALRCKAAPDNPLGPELESLAGMVQSVIAELRDFAGSVARRDPNAPEPLCGAALARLVVQMRERYGMTVKLDVQTGMELGDRLAAEVVQIVREGLNNIGKHTGAREGVVKVRLAERMLRIEIDNANADGREAMPFVPHSIRQRAAVLGGQVRVHRVSCATAVCVEIPI